MQTKIPTALQAKLLPAEPFALPREGNLCSLFLQDLEVRRRLRPERIHQSASLAVVRPIRIDVYTLDGAGDAGRDGSEGSPTRARVSCWDAASDRRRAHD